MALRDVYLGGLVPLFALSDRLSTSLSGEVRGVREEDIGHPEVRRARISCLGRVQGQL